MLPELPEVATPLDKETDPVITPPEVSNSNAPLYPDANELDPDAIDTLPPFAAVDKPATITTSPPLPLAPLPTLIETIPPLPECELPDPM